MDTRTLALLGQTFEGIGKIDKAIAVFRELARISGQKGDRAKQRQAMEHIVTLNPKDPDAIRFLAAAGAQVAQDRKQTSWPLMVPLMHTIIDGSNRAMPLSVIYW